MLGRLAKIIQLADQRPAIPLAGLFGLTSGSGWVSWFEATKPLMQWGVAAFGCLTGFIGALLALRQLYKAIKADFFTPKTPS